MDCFREGPNFLVIDPQLCIDCSVCVPECPVDAIVGDREINDDQRHFIALNAQLAQHSDWKPITRAKSPMADHAHWREVPNKFNLLQKTADCQTHIPERS